MKQDLMQKVLEGNIMGPMHTQEFNFYLPQKTVLSNETFAREANKTGRISNAKANLQYVLREEKYDATLHVFFLEFQLYFIYSTKN